MCFTAFINAAFSDFSVFLTVAITLSVAFVNGCTDAPNAIASSVSTRCMSLKKAVVLAAVFDFLGSVSACLFSRKVTETIIEIASFGKNPKEALISLSAAMSAVVIWATAAWAFGIPTSESHALVAGLIGAGIAANAGFDGMVFGAVNKVAQGLLLSTVLGFFFGFVSSRITVSRFKNIEKTRTDSFFKYSQIASSMLMAFMHGAQDAQKFVGILSLVMSLATDYKEDMSMPLWMIFICSAAISLGTATGGARIIKSVGMDMVKLRRDQGFAADVAGAICLFISTALGLPVSTTHTKTSAVLGVGAAKSVKSVDWSVASEMAAAWLLTFPGCSLLSFAVALIYRRVML